MFIDTHTHLYSNKFDGDREEMLSRAWEQKIDLALMPAIDSSTHDAMLRVERDHPDRCLAMIGLHPVSVKEDFEKELAVVEEYLRQRKWVAIGEIGMDLYWDKQYKEQQREAFQRQCGWAIQYDLPISIHARDAIDHLLELIEEIADERLTGVFHCFTGDVIQAQRAVELGFYLGIGGVATFKNGGLEPVLRQAPKNRILLETDSPYLAPHPKRGKRNESAYLPYIAEKLAGLWSQGLEEVGRQTNENARQLFALDRFSGSELP